MPKETDITISYEEFERIVLLNYNYVKSIGSNNDVGCHALIDNELIDMYLYSENK